MHANLYFIGSEAVSVHLLETAQGLVLIDTGYPSMREQILENIEALHFSVQDICAIFHTHGHIDHFGNTQELAAISRAKTYISRIDNAILTGELDLSWAKELHLEPIPPFSCDGEIEDGQVFSFGDTSIRFVHTPGHTEGTMSLIITLCDQTIAAMHGGIGMNSMRSDFLKQYGLSFACRERFKDSLEKLAGEHVDLVLGNHPHQNNTLLKMQKVLSGASSILDASEWPAFLEATKKQIEHLIETDPAL